MSTLVDLTVTRVDPEAGDALSSPTSVESSPDCVLNSQNDIGTSSESNIDCQDSGVALNFSSGFKRNLNRSPNFNGWSSCSPGIHQASGLNLNLRSNKVNGSAGQPGYQGTPLSDVRRPSIDYMMNTGGLFINQRGTCEINLDYVNATDLEQFYAEANVVQQRRASCSVSAGYGGVPGKDDLSLAQKLSVRESSEHISSSEDMKVSKYWWSPKFNSEVLEKQLRKTVIEFLRSRFRVALVFIGVFALVWVVVFSVNIPFSPPINRSEVDTRNNELAVYSVQYSPWYVVGGVILFVCIGMLLVSTFTRLYAKFTLSLSLFLASILMLCSFALALSLYFNKDVQGFLTMSFVAQFAITAVFILFVFTLSRLPLWLSVVLSVVYLIVLECLVGVFSLGLDSKSGISLRTYYSSAAARLLLYVSLILSGVTTAYLSQVRQVATFWKIAQCVLSQKALDLERELEEKTILSMMPKHFADGLLNIHVQMMFMLKQRVVQENEGSLDPVYQSISAPFNICSMDNVTILFADIVNFTSFSSSLSAAELVGILNAVFSMFDELVTKHNCEKISTLGDCYFCVSGCPEPEEGHADNCVNMGLAIIKALEDYRKMTKWPIEMRVGIHTGSVFCGVMGTKRFKFDVWSRDVRIANQIESVGMPCQVLISSSTYSCLSGSYMIEHANIQTVEPELVDLELYYVTGQRSRTQSSGISGMEWKKKINTIDTIHKSDYSENNFNHNRKDSVTSIQNSLCPCWQRQKATTPPRRMLAEGHSSSSIVDIQTQLQRCTSYAELAVPKTEEEKENADIDEDIVKYMEEHKVHFDTYFDPQLQVITLNFHDHDWESTYRKYGRDLDDGLNGELTEMELGYRITKLSYMLDTMALFISFLLIMISSAICLSADDTFKNVWYAWLGIFLFGMFVEASVLVFVFAVFSPHRFPECFAKFAAKIINWYVRSLVALFFIYYPMTVACISMAHCQSFGDSATELAGLAHVQLTFFITIIVLVSSITFMEVSHIVKFVGGFLSGSLAIVMVVIVRLSLCVREITDPQQMLATPAPVQLNELVQTVKGPNRTFPTSAPDSYLKTYYTRHIAPEAIILLLLVIILLTLVNRMSEVSVRLSFIARIEASARRRLTRQRKVQAEWLLFNIIPPSVAYKLRTTGKFSQNHECVGVMFASIVNFRHFLQNDENDGEDSLRFLNIIISEFDMLLERQQFASVEKIKTIGSTYMAASGLNLTHSDEESDPVAHLLDLINFGHQLVEVLELLNQKLTGFVFEMHIGFNYGPVTSGVVGSRKMLYDIWGDTVNVASRMASTGAVNKIHVPQSCLEKLGPHVTHTVHKVVNVKGKGEMSTVFITPPLQTISLV